MVISIWISSLAARLLTKLRLQLALPIEYTTLASDQSSYTSNGDSNGMTNSQSPVSNKEHPSASDQNAIILELAVPISFLMPSCSYK